MIDRISNSSGATMNCRVQSLALLGLSMLVLALPCAARAGGDDSRPVTPADQIEFQQKTAQAQMQELQERMYRLAEMSRQAEPDDAARLLMALPRRASSSSLSR